MKSRILIILSILVLVVLSIMFWLRPKHGTDIPTQTQETIQAINPAASNINTANRTIPSPIAVSAPTNSTLTVYSNKLRTPEGFKQYVEGHNAAIDFYGRFIDQDNNSLPGVKINVAIRHWTLPVPAVLEAGTTEIRLQRVTDADGRFDIHGETGDGFDIEVIQKDGYDVEPGQRTFGAVTGSFENPMIFKMWSTNVHEHLIGGEKAFHIVPDGRPYFINLTDGTITESGTGDLKIWVRRPDGIALGQKYDWSCEVAAINGGLLEQPLGSAMYSAPPEGYVPSFQFKQTTGSGWGDSTGERQFYVTLNNGQEYGRISIELYAYYNNQIPAMVRLSYAINPSGSRILR